MNARKTPSLFICILTVFSIPLPALGQERYYRFARLTVEDGLSSFRAYDVVQDSMGFLWIATLEGLNRYDGNTITVFRNKENDTTSISHNTVRSLLVDRSGALWAGTADGGLNRFDPVTERFIRFTHDPANPRSLSGGHIGCLYEDRAGAIWIGTRGKGLNKLMWGNSTGRHPGTPEFLHYRHDPKIDTSLSDDRVYTIMEDSRGILWVGTENGLNALDRNTGKFTRYMNDPADHFSLSSNFVVTLLEDQSNNIWIGTDRGGLNKFERQSGRFFRFRHDPSDPRSLGSNDVYALFEDEQGRLWIGRLEGLDIFDPHTGVFTHFRHDKNDPASLSDNYIRSIRSDRTGNIWVVTDRGLSKVTRNVQRIAHYRHATRADESQIVRSLFEQSTEGRSHDPVLWIGTDGLKKLNLQTGKQVLFRHNPVDPHSLNSDFVIVVFEDRARNIWAGTQETGLNRYHPGTNTFRRYAWESGEQNHSVVSICEGDNGVLWLGTLAGGLIRFDPRSGRFDQFRHNPTDTTTISNNNVIAVLMDSRGNLWVATDGGGLDMAQLHNTRERDNVRSAMQFKHHRHRSSDRGSISNDRVYALHEDRSGTLWVSTVSGLNSYDPESGRFSFRISSDSLGGSFCLRILEDRDGLLWLSTLQSGIFCFDPVKGTLRNYRVEDGLQSNQFSYAAFTGRNGEIIFGGENGWNVFHPDSIAQNTHIPPVVLTSFRIFDKPAELGTSIPSIKGITLAYNQNFFSFEFAALDFTVPARNRFAYTLEGLDPDWVYPQARRAIYTKVDPGEYVLKVKGSNNDGVWNEQGIAIPLVITPPFWATWWFRTLAGLTLIAILAALYNYRVSKLLEMERMRVRIASDLHDDIGSSLSSIALITDMVRKRLPPDIDDQKHLLTASTAARHTADALKDIVWIINPEHDKLDDIVLRMKDSAAKLLVGIEYTFDCPQNAMDDVLDMEFRRNLLLIYKEALNNIAKYAHATRVDIAIRRHDGTIELHVADNGVGFDLNTVRKGNGLDNLSRRATSIGGTIEIHSRPGLGTTIQLAAKIP